jgi:hypothetical protein
MFNAIIPVLDRYTDKYGHNCELNLAAEVKVRLGQLRLKSTEFM